MDNFAVCKTDQTDHVIEAFACPTAQSEMANFNFIPC